MDNPRKSQTRTLRIAAANALRSGLVDEAIAIYRRVLGAVELDFGCKSVEFAEALEDLAEAFALANDLLAAERSLRGAAEVLADILPPEDVRLANTLRCLSDLCARQGNELESRRFAEEARNLVANHVLNND